MFDVNLGFDYVRLGFLFTKLFGSVKISEKSLNLYFKFTCNITLYYILL